MTAVKLSEGHISLGSSGTLFYRQAEPSDGKAKLSVLLLHGIRFSSENWLTIGTLEILAKAGCRVVGIDLPGLGNSKAAVAPAAVGELAPGDFLKQVLEALQLGPAVVVSPSLSGMYSLPFLFQNSSLVRAYIPVAPICTEKFTPEQYSSIQKTHLCPASQDLLLGPSRGTTTLWPPAPATEDTCTAWPKSNAAAPRKPHHSF